MWFIGVEVEPETSAPPPKKNPGSAPAIRGWKTAHVVVRITWQELSLQNSQTWQNVFLILN